MLKKKDNECDNKINCPKCGKLGWVVEMKKKYFPKRHYDKPRIYKYVLVIHSDKSKKKTSCYLGSVNPIYGKKFDIKKLMKVKERCKDAKT